MRGYWHIVALSVVFAALSIILDKNLFLFVLIWLLYLFLDQRIRILPLMIAMLSFLFYFHHIPQLGLEVRPPPQQNKQQIYSGTIVDEPIINRKKIEFIMEESETADKYMVLYFPNEVLTDFQLTQQLKYGATCEIKGGVELPEQATNPGQFDYRQFLLTKNISHQIIIDELDDIHCEGSIFWQRFFTLRSKLMEQAPHKVSHYTASWINALVLGDKSKMDEPVIEVFQKWGLSHLLAISGLHIGIVVGIIYFGLIKLNLLTKEKAELVMLLFLPIYAVLAGGEPSVLRASLMVILLIIARRLKINIDALDVISIAFLLLILLDAYIIYHIGFQFSFIVTFGIILSRKWLTSVTSPGFQILIISFVSQMVILPLQLDYFSLFQPLSILLNVIIIPYFSIFVIPFMFLLLFVSFFPAAILSIFDGIFITIHRFVIAGIEWIDHWFDYPLFLTELPFWFYIIYYVILFIALYLLTNQYFYKAFFSFVLLIIFVFGYASVPYFSAKGYVTMLDIGQGDAFMIELPYRKGTVMIDAGSKFSFEDMKPTKSVYKQIIQPYLRYKGIHKLDALFLTHEDTDHIGSTKFMIDEGIVDRLYVSEFFPITAHFESEVREGNVDIHRLKKGETVQVKDQLLNVLGPSKDKQKANENSLVLYTKIGGRRWLFTGDISKEEERELLQHYPLQVDVLKVGHHGSSTSTDHVFIKAIDAKTALISVGKHNRYGHPTKEVIETLESHGIQIFRSDLHGAVQYQYVDDSGVFYIYSRD